MKIYGIKNKEMLSYFYKLRGLWIKAFVSEVNSNFEYIEREDEVKVIRRK